MGGRSKDESLQGTDLPKVGTKRGRWSWNDLEGQAGVRQVSQSSRLEGALERSSRRSGADQEPDDGVEKRVALEVAISGVSPKNRVSDAEMRWREQGVLPRNVAVKMCGLLARGWCLCLYLRLERSWVIGRRR